MAERSSGSEKQDSRNKEGVYPYVQSDKDTKAMPLGAMRWQKSFTSCSKNSSCHMALEVKRGSG